MLGCSMAERIPALPAVPTLAESGVSAAPLITAHFVLGPPRLPTEHGRPACGGGATGGADGRVQAGDGAPTHPRWRPIAGRDARELMLQAEAQYVQFVRETGASID
jgi:hypothetical protein